MAKLPKSLIKKYGISKKAWAVFRGKKTKSRVQTMAKRRTHKKGYRKTSGFSFGKLTQIAIGAGVAALYEVFVSPMIPLANNIKNIVELVAGLLIAVMPKLPMAVRAGGAALATINAYALIVPLIQGFKGGTSSSSNAWTY